jgi:hypothetical protein
MYGREKISLLPSVIRRVMEKKETNFKKAYILIKMDEHVSRLIG